MNAPHPLRPPPGRGQVHVHFHEPSGDAPSPADWATLSPDQRARAQRFKFPGLRDDFVLVHAWLRRLLGSYLDRDPSAVEYEWGTRGKPAIATRMNPLRLRFNLSHAGSRALVGIACEAAIGVDLEPLVRSMPDRGDIATRFFAPEERDAVLGAGDEASGDEASTEVFLRIWTRKEAYIKARGDGLYMPLDAFQVPLQPGPGLVGVVREESGSAWEVHDVAGEGVLGAVVIQGEGWTIIQ